jgi:2,3-bisphosphoglycerate-independent phosphoglycerate mutase
MVLPDHPTPLSVRTHTADPVPFVIYSSDEGGKNNPAATFDEVFAQQSGVFFENGFELIERFFAS